MRAKWTVPVLVSILILVGLMIISTVYAQTFVTKWGSFGTDDGQFKFPTGIAVDSSGNVYVVDTNNNRIQKFTSTGTFITKWGSFGTGDGQFIGPTGIAVDSSGNVYVVDTQVIRIQKFTSTGTFITKWSGFEFGGAPFSGPLGVGVDSSGNVYVADSGNNRIQEFTSTGIFITKWGFFGTGDGQFSFPFDVAVDSSGNVYVADTFNHRIQKFTSTGTFITKWGSFGTGDGQFKAPTGIAVDSSDNVYVVDANNGRIQKFTSTGTFITKFGSSGNGDGQFNNPRRVAPDSSGNLYVTDQSNHRIQVFGTPDTTPPVVTISGDITREATSSAGAVVNYPAATALDDVDGPITPACLPLSGSQFALGDTIVVCSATDLAGNTGSAQFTVTVQDTTAPTITAPPNIEVIANTAGGATGVNLGTPSVSDIVDSNPVVTDNAPTLFPLGDTIVTWKARDFSGNEATATQKVTVKPFPIVIDIKPGSDPNCFNNDGHGVIPVAILGSNSFDVTQVDTSTILLDSMAVKAVGKANKLLSSIEDVNGDGFNDLVVKIEDVDGVFIQGTGTATLTGNLLDGTPIEGSDSICITQ